MEQNNIGTNNVSIQRASCWHSVDSTAGSRLDLTCLDFYLSLRHGGGHDGFKISPVAGQRCKVAHLLQTLRDLWG